MEDTEKRKNAIIKLTNKLLSNCNIEKRIDSLNELNSNIFVKIYEFVCSSELVDKIDPIKSIEDEIHNIQAIIDSISLDILHEDLTHITGESVINKDIVSIEYLLDILISIQEWLLPSRSNTINESNNNHYNHDLNTSSTTSTSSSKSDFEQKNDFINENNNKKYSNNIDRQVLKELNSNNNNNNNSCGNIYDLNKHLFEKEKQIDNLKKFLDTSQSSIEYLTKYKEKTDEQIKYLELEKEIENTVKMTQDALKHNLPPSLAGLTNSITSSAMMINKVNNDSKINKIQQKQQINDDTLFNLISNDNKTQQRLSTSGIGVLSDIKRKKQEILNKKNERKSVKFDDDYDNDDSNSIISSSQYSSKSDLFVNDSKRYIEQDTTNELSIIRDKIKDCGDKDEKIIKKLLKFVYEDDLKDAESLLRQSSDKIKYKSELTNNLYIDAHRPASSASVRVPNKSVFIADNYKKPLVRYSSTSPTRHNNNNNHTRRRSQSSLRQSKNKSKYIIGEDGILSKLLEEFPHLYLSPETIHNLWEKHSKQIEHLQRENHELETKYSKDNDNTVIKKRLNETQEKQKKLMEIMSKEIEHMQRVQDLKRKQNVENSLKCKAREQRFQNVKVKNYFEEFRLQQRAKMLKKLTKEEILFKKLFNESIKIQKERIREMKRYAKEQRDIKTKQQLNQIESIENFYKNKFNLLNEEIKKEKLDNEIREKAQHDILTKMKSQLKNKLETDIRDLQSQLCNDEDFMYWRQLDANRVEDDLKFARYKATV